MTPSICIVAALARNRVIGLNNTLPWHLPEDLKRFKALTMGKPIIMGRKTFESLPGRLPGRTKIIVSRNAPTDPTIKEYSPHLTHPELEQTYLCHSLEEAIQLSKLLTQDEIMIIGGGEIFQQSLPLANKMYLTLIEHDVSGDSYFPEFSLQNWRVVAEETFPESPAFEYPYRFMTLVSNSE
jgi:dihydrofolate reductase